MTAIGKHVQRRMSALLPGGSAPATSTPLTPQEFRTSVEDTLRGQGLTDAELADRMARYDIAVGRTTSRTPPPDAP